MKRLIALIVWMQAIAALADAPLIWGPSGSAQLLNSGNLVAKNGNVYPQSDNSIVASTAIIADASGYLTSSATTATQISYLSTTTSDVQVQINGKAAKGANSDITSLSGLTTPLSVGQGGSGAASFTANDVLLGNGTSAFQVVAPGSSGHVLTSNGTTWQSSAPATSGTVTSVGFSGAGGIFSVSGSPVTSSGTISETVAGTSGGIPYFSSSSALGSSAALTASQLVLGGGAGSAPTSLAAGSQYQVLTMGASNPGYGAVSLAQSAAVTGQLGVSNGGTGLSSLTANGVLLGNGTGTPTFVAPGSSGNVLLSNGTTWTSGTLATGLTTAYEASTFTAAAAYNYLVNTTSSAFTATLPAGASGATIQFVDDASTWATNPLTICPNGSQTIQGITAGSCLVANISGAFVQVSWDNTNSYWTVTSNGFYYLPNATSTLAGQVSTSAQSFAGEKTFTTGYKVSNFQAVRSDANFSITASTSPTPTLFNWTTTNWNSNSDFGNNATYGVTAFNCTIPGVYYFTLQLWFAGGLLTTDTIDMQIVKNGSQTLRKVTTGFSGNALELSGSIILSSGDAVYSQLAITSASGSHTVTVYNNATQVGLSWFEGFYEGAGS
jgi:hypothetical protein